MNKGGTEVPSYQKEVGTRIRAVSDLVGSRRKAAKIANVSDDMLFRYIRGASKQPFDVVARLCAEENISMEWVWTGKGEMIQGKYQVDENNPEYGAKDRESYLRALQVIEEVLQAKSLNIKPHKKVKLVKLVAEMIEKDDEDVIKPQLLQLVALAS